MGSHERAALPLHHTERWLTAHLLSFGTHDLPKDFATGHAPFLFSVKHRSSCFSIASDPTQQLLDDIKQLLALAARVHGQNDSSEDRSSRSTWLRSRRRSV